MAARSHDCNSSNNRRKSTESANQAVCHREDHSRANSHGEFVVEGVPARPDGDGQRIL
jgi:hypothetical protein